MNAAVVFFYRAVVVEFEKDTCSLNFTGFYTSLPIGAPYDIFQQLNLFCRKNVHLKATLFHIA